MNKEKLNLNICDSKFAEKEYKAEQEKSERLDDKVMQKLRSLLFDKKKKNKVSVPVTGNKLKPIYDESQRLYKKAIELYNSKEKEHAVTYYELANMKYSHYLKVKEAIYSK